jgi:hypothetical protein
MTPSEREPMVIVDFVFEDGLFFIAIKNISANPVYDVSVTFDKKFTGVEGAKDISSLRLFRNIPFLAPQKEIVAFLDTSASYFRRRQPTNIRATIHYKNAAGAVCKSVIRHDLSIYKEIGYVRAVTGVDGEKAFGRTRQTEADERL